MTDREKLMAFRAEVERLKDSFKVISAVSPSRETTLENIAKSALCKQLLSFYDSMQKEPKFKAGDHIKPIDSCLGAPRTILEVRDGWYVTNQGTLDFEFEDNWELAEEHKKCMYSKDNYTDEDRKVLCDGCEEECEYNKKEPSIPDIVDEHFEEMLEDTIEKQFKVGDVVIYAASHIAYAGLYLLGNPNDLSIGYSNANEPYNIALRNCTVASEEEHKQFMRELESNGYKWNESSLRIEKKEEPVSDDLEKEIEQYCIHHGYLDSFKDCGYTFNEQVGDIARHFANWQKKQMEAYRIKHCNSITNEQAELESEFVSSHIEKNNRMPTFLDAIEYGMNLQKEQMVKDAIGGVITFDYYGDGDKTYGCIAHNSFCLEDRGLKDMDKVKIVIIKEGGEE